MQAFPAWAVYKLDTVYKQLSAFSLFDPFFVPHVVLGVLVAANVVVVLGLIFVAIEKTRLALREPHPIASIVGRRTAVIGLAGVFLMAPKGFVGLVNPGERLVLPLLFLALSLPYRPRLPTRLRRAAMPMLATLVAIQFSFIGVQGHRAATVMRSLIDVVAEVQGMLALVQESHFKDPSILPRSASLRSYAALPRHYPLARTPLYIANKQQLAIPIFDTGLFRGVANAPLVRDIDGAQNSNCSIFVAGEQKRVAEISGRIARHQVVSRGTNYALLSFRGEAPTSHSQQVPQSPLDIGTSEESTRE